MSAIKKKFFWIYGRQTTTKIADTSLDKGSTDYRVDTGICGDVPPWQGQSSPATLLNQVTNWGLIGEMSSGGQKGISADAFLKAEKGDTLPLAGGDVPVISEKILAEFKSFDVDAAAWATSAIGGALGAMPLRKRLCTLETGKNVDLAFVDPDTCEKITGTAVNYFLWNVPFHVGLDVPAGGTPTLPCSIEKEVPNASDHVSVVTVDLT